MADEANNSLPEKQDAEGSLNRGSAFQLHYFPEIPVGNGKTSPVKPGQHTQFRRLHGLHRHSSPKEKHDPLREPFDGARLSQSSTQDIETEAYVRGFNQGEKAGYDSARKKIEPVLQGLTSALAALDQIRQARHRGAEKEIVELSLAIAKKVIHREVTCDPAVIVSVTKAALEKAGEQEGLRIKMSPSDIDFLNRIDFNEQEFTDHLGGLHIVADETLQPGGCVIETDCGDIDARIEKQLEVVEEALKDFPDIRADNPPVPLND